MCGGSPRSELKKMKLYGPSRSTVGIKPNCPRTCFHTQRKDFTQKREKWLLKPNARRELRLAAVSSSALFKYAAHAAVLRPLFLPRSVYEVFLRNATTR